MSNNAHKSPTMVEFVGRNVALVWPVLNSSTETVLSVSSHSILYLLILSAQFIYLLKFLAFFIQLVRSKMSYKLSALDTIHVSAVLEDCVDQLAILGSIIPVSSENHRGQVIYVQVS